MKRLLPFALLLTVVACSGQKAEDERPVARIQGKTLTRGALDAWLEANLADAVEDDLVRTRLFERWIEEQLLLAEARERMLTIPDESLDVLLGDPDAEADEEPIEVRRASLRRRLMIEMLQGQVLQDILPPTEEQAEAWLLEHDEPRGPAGRSVKLRSLRFDDPERALVVHRGLRRNRMTFNEAVLQNTEDESQGVATVVEFATLPPEVQGAIGDLEPGWSSKPVELGGSTYLFQVVRWIETGPAARLETARREMFAAARREAWEAFVTELRGEARIRVFEENLPFRLVSP